MNSPAQAKTWLTHRHAAWLLVIGWMLITLKCVAVAWAIEHWQVPIHPFWIIGPTLLFALLVTMIWAGHREP